MHTFIENYLHFMKNCIRPHYEKFNPLKSGFIENSNFENNRNPCINIYWGLFCPMFRRIAPCPQSSVQRSLLKKTLTDTRGRDARIHMCRSLCSDTLFFFLYLENFGWEQLKKPPCSFQDELEGGEEIEPGGEKVEQKP